MAWTFPDNRISINARITFGAAWNDVDLGTNNDVPSGTTAVILQIRVVSASDVSYKALTRPNGSVEDRSTNAITGCDSLFGGTHKFLFAKLDANRVFDGYFANSALDVAVVAYTDNTNSQFFATSTDKSLASTGSYIDIDCSVQIPAGGVAAIWEIESTSTTKRNFALRANGSSFDKYYGIVKGASGYVSQGSMFGIVGLDGSRICEGKIANIAVNFYLWGYLGSEYSILEDTTDRAPGSTGSWQDVDVSSIVPAGAVGVALLLVNNTDAGSPYLCNVRKKGSTDNIITHAWIGQESASSMIYAVVGIDSNRVFQAYISNAAIDIYVLGYFSAAATQYSIIAGGGSYNESGTIADLLKNSLISAGAGSYIETGFLIDLLKNSVLVPDSGAYSWDGVVASLLKNSVISAEAGAYVLTGSEVALILSGSTYTLVCSSGEIIETGTIADLLKNSVIVPAAGAYVEAGQIAALLKHSAILAESGAYLEAGDIADLLKSCVIVIESGSYWESGASVDLIYSGGGAPVSGWFIIRRRRRINKRG